MVVEAGFGEQVDHAAGRPGLRVARTEHDAPDAGMHDRAGAHGAGFQGHVQGAARQTVVAQARGGIAQGHDFGMGGGIVAADRLVEAAPDHFAVDHHQAPTGTSPAGARLARQIKRQPHEFAVIHGADYGIGRRFGPLGVLADRAARVHQLRLRGSEARNRHARPGTGNVGQADAVAEMDRAGCPPCSPQMPTLSSGLVLRPSARQASSVRRRPSGPAPRRGCPRGCRSRCRPAGTCSRHPRG
jgi:hypothetical protein